MGRKSVARLHRSGLLGVALYCLTACGGSGNTGGSNTFAEQDTGNLTAADCANVIVSGNFTAPVVLQNTASACDYYVVDYAVFRSALTVEAGTVIMMANNAIVQHFDGSITAVGTPEQRIRIIGEQAQPGYWQGLQLTGLRPSRLEYVDIQDGGNNSPVIRELRAGLAVQRSNLSLVNVSVSNSFVTGVYLDTDTTLSAFASNNFFGNAFEGLHVSSLLVSELDTESDYLGQTFPNGNPWIRVRYNGDFPVSPVSWKRLNAPYRADNVFVSDEDELMIEAGVELLVEGKIWAFSGGSFNSRGTAESPVILKNSPDNDGPWQGIDVGRRGLVSMEHTIVEGAVDGIFIDSDGVATLSNTAINNNRDWGIRCDSISVLGEPPRLQMGNGVVFAQNGLGNISPDCPL